jgi:hypothetical protein
MEKPGRNLKPDCTGMAKMKLFFFISVLDPVWLNKRSWWNG